MPDADAPALHADAPADRPWTVAELVPGTPVVDGTGRAGGALPSDPAWIARTFAKTLAVGSPEQRMQLLGQLIRAGGPDTDVRFLATSDAPHPRFHPLESR